MYAFTVKSEDAIDEFSIKKGSEKNELFYWRKNNALHGWMNRLYTAKGGSANPSDFNCKYIQLTAKDLLQLQQDILYFNLKPEAGFFFGEMVYDNYWWEKDLEFIAKALASIASGYVVYYDSWW